MSRYSYALNNPLKYTDPSGYETYLSPGCMAYTNHGSGGGLSPSDNHWAESWNKIPMYGSANVFSGGWVYNYNEGAYVNQMTGATKTGFAFINTTPYLRSSEYVISKPEVVAETLSRAEEISVNPLFFVLGETEYVNGLSFIGNSGTSHYYFADQDPVDLSGNNFMAVLFGVLFNTKRGTEFNEMIDVRTLSRYFTKNKGSDWSSGNYKYKDRNYLIKIHPSSGRSEFDGLKLITSTGYEQNAFKGMDLIDIPNISGHPDLPYNDEFNIYPYHLRARFNVFDRAGNPRGSRYMINFSFRSYDLLMRALNVYAK